MYSMVTMANNNVYLKVPERVDFKSFQHKGKSCSSVVMNVN